ncbi:hypothetical protein KC336_g15961, partial [Hortaea werneckii]
VLAVIFFWPETKGRTLEEMDELFGSGGFAQRDLEMKNRIEREIGLTALLGFENHESPMQTDEKLRDSGSEDMVEKREA